MSIFGKIAAAIFGGSAHAAPVTDAAKSGAPVLPADATTTLTPPPGAKAGEAAPAATAAIAMKGVDVAAVLDQLDEASDLDDIDWRKSIVDLMKLLKLDSSLTSRKQLAKELGYSGDMSDSAKMNVWLHKQVMTQLAENGGVVPAALKH